MKRTDYRLSHFALTMLILTMLMWLALTLPLPNEVFADNNAYSFAGQYTAPSCGAPFDFTIGAGTKTIDVVASTIPANDIVLKLYHNGILIFQQDTGTSPEPIHYALPAGADLDTGEYSVVVCPFNGEAALTPSDYAGLVTVSELPLPPIAPPGSLTNPVTVYPIPSFQNWNARFAPATVVDPQRTEGEPLVKIDADGNLWESGPWGFSTNMSFIHRSTNDGKKFHLVSTIGTRPDEPPGGGDTDVAVDDQGNVYFTDLEGPLTEIGASVSNDNGNTWRKNAAAVQQTVVDRQWYAVDNGATSGAFDNTVFLAFHTSAVGTFIYSSAGSQGPNDPTGGLFFQNSASLPGPLQALAADAICAQLRFDKVKRNLYYACNEGDHVRVTVGHVGGGQRMGISYANYNGPRTPGGGDVLNLFPALAVDAAGNVYVAWIDDTNFNLYYAFSTDEGRSWSAPVRVNSGGAVTNEFDWAQAGAAGTLALAWYASDKAVPGGSDNMPSSLDNLGEATKFPWFGYAALITKANTARPKIAQTRFTSKPMHYGAICNAGLGCTTDPGADRQMADFFGFDIGKDGALRIVFNDTTNEFDGAGLFFTKQISGAGAFGGNVSGRVATNPVSAPTGDANWPHYARGGPGASLPQLDLSSLRVSNPDPTTLRVKMTVKDLSQLLPPAGKTSSVWLTRFQALAPRPGGPENVYRVFYIYMESVGGLTPSFFAGTASCQGTTPSNCKILQYRGEKPATGKVEGNTITIDVGLKTGFGVAIQGNTLYSVTAFTLGRSNSVDDLYFDVDATEAFDYVLGSDSSK
jgi:hypothetical protein